MEWNEGVKVVRASDSKVVAPAGKGGRYAINFNGLVSQKHGRITPAVNTSSSLLTAWFFRPPLDLLGETKTL